MSVAEHITMDRLKGGGCLLRREGDLNNLIDLREELDLDRPSSLRLNGRI